MNNQNQFLLYTAPDGAVKVDVFVKDETVWLTQKALAELFGVQRPAVTKHLLNIFNTGELVENSVGSILEHTAGDGKTYAAKYYNLDAIIAVGYRVNSRQATLFRIWATKVGESQRDSGHQPKVGVIAPTLGIRRNILATATRLWPPLAAAPLGLVQLTSSHPR